MSRKVLIERIAAAIATMEGWDILTSRARKNNNPGNLRSWGAAPKEAGYAYFQTEEDGWAALRMQVAKNIGRKLTMYEFFGGKAGVYAGYAPAADNNYPVRYAEFVAAKVGLDPSRTIISYVTGD